MMYRPVTVLLIEALNPTHSLCEPQTFRLHDDEQIDYVVASYSGAVNNTTVPQAEFLMQPCSVRANCADMSS